MASCPTCQAEVVDSRTLEIHSHRGYRALVSCSGCLSILDVALQDLDPAFEETPYRGPQVVVTGAIATRLLDRLERASDPSTELDGLDETTSLVLRIPEVFRVAKTLFEEAKAVTLDRLCVFVCPSIRDDGVSLLMRAPSDLPAALAPMIGRRQARGRKVLSPEETLDNGYWFLLEGAELTVCGSTEAGLLLVPPLYRGQPLALRALEAPLDVLKPPRTSEG